VEHRLIVRRSIFTRYSTQASKIQITGSVRNQAMITPRCVSFPIPSVVFLPNSTLYQDASNAGIVAMIDSIDVW
jgi:hypothetical protein